MERLNLRQLEIFSAVVDAGSFTAAAEKLYLAQSTVSDNVRALEEQRAAEAMQAAQAASEREEEPASDGMTPIMRKGVETMNRCMAANAEREGREAAAPEKYEYLIKVRLDAVEYATLIGFLKQQGIKGTISKRKAQENGAD